jgi:hypothetical protein
MVKVSVELHYTVSFQNAWTYINFGCICQGMCVAESFVGGGGGKEYEK